LMLIGGKKYKKKYMKNNSIMLFYNLPNKP
jgi:hypothetical protein